MENEIAPRALIRVRVHARMTSARPPRVHVTLGRKEDVAAPESA
jgi:hypothetical protein